MTTRAEELQRQVVAFHHAHPEVWREFERIALELIRRGRSHYGAKAIMEKIRCDTALGGGDVFKINNNFTSAYARAFAKRHPEHAGFFEFRERKSESAPAREVAA